jgi:DNA-binding NarL/FixJ family response regulator
VRKIVSDKRGVSEETVKGHVGNIVGKLSTNDRTHPVTFGIKHGIIEV